MWLCSVHNMVNARLGKDEFDCLTLNDVYDCGCGPESEEGKTATTEGDKPKEKAKVNRPLGGLGGKGNTAAGAEPGSVKAGSPDVDEDARKALKEHAEPEEEEEDEEGVRRLSKSVSDHGKAVKADPEEISWGNEEDLLDRRAASSSSEEGARHAR